MPVPQINLLEAFAIGIPLGIAGYAVQETLIRRRASKPPAEGPALARTELRPAETAPDSGADDGENVTFPLPIPVTRPSRTRPKRPLAVPPEAGPARPVEAAAAAAPAVSAVAAPTPAPRARRAPASPVVAATPAAEPTVPSPATAPSTKAAAAKPAPPKAAAAKPPKPLLKRAADYDAALEAVVDFVDGQPRRARAQACSDAIARLVPKTRRGPAQSRFEAAVQSGTAPGELQEMAESVGIELARALNAVREEIKGYS